MRVAPISGCSYLPLCANGSVGINGCTVDSWGYRAWHARVSRHWNEPSNTNTVKGSCDLSIATLRYIPAEFEGSYLGRLEGDASQADVHDLPPAWAALTTRRVCKYPGAGDRVAPVRVRPSQLADLLHHLVCLLLVKRGHESVARKGLEPANHVCRQSRRAREQPHLRRLQAMLDQELLLVSPTTARTCLPGCTAGPWGSTMGPPQWGCRRVGVQSHAEPHEPRPCAVSN